MQMLVDQALHAMERRPDRIAGHEPCQDLWIQALIRDHSPMHVGRLLGAAGLLQLGMGIDAHPRAVRRPGDHAIQVIGIPSPCRLPEIDREPHDQDLVDPFVDMLAEPHRMPAAPALVVEHDPLAQAAAEQAEAVGEALIASRLRSVAAKSRNRPEKAESGW